MLLKLQTHLGQEKKKHKILVVYLTIAELLSHHRLSVEQMQQDFKYFGQGLAMGHLVKYVKDYENGWYSVS